MNLTILEKNAAWIAVQKPCGISSESGGMGLLIARTLGIPEESVYPVHRLDREVSGVMVYALTREAAAFFSRAAAERRMRKTYLALVSGTPAEEQGRWEDLLFHDARRNKTFTADRIRKGVKPAVLDYRVLRRIPADDPDNDTGQELSLLEIHLGTGRTHQIRVQCASRGLPLIGDRKYGGIRWRGIGLTAWKLAFPDPAAGREREFTAAVPDPLFDPPAPERGEEAP